MNKIFCFSINKVLNIKKLVGLFRRRMTTVSPIFYSEEIKVFFLIRQTTVYQASHTLTLLIFSLIFTNENVILISILTIKEQDD